MHRQRDPAVLSELHSVADEVDEHLPQPRGIPDQGVGHVEAPPEDEVDAFVGGAGRDERQDLVEHLVQLERNPLELDPARLELRQVEDLVDQRQQPLRGHPDRPEVARLCVGEVRARQQVRHAHDGVHGRADLMAHRRQEGALGLAGLLGEHLGFPQLHRPPAPLGDVLGEGQQVPRGPDVIQDRDLPRVEPPRPPGGLERVVR